MVGSGQAKILQRLVDTVQVWCQTTAAHVSQKNEGPAVATRATNFLERMPRSPTGSCRQEAWEPHKNM